MISDDDRSLIEYLMGENAFSDDAKAGTYAYISNPDGTIRWIYPEELKKPYFLNFYSTASFRAKVLSTLIKVAFFAKQSHRVKSGELKLNISKESRLGKVLSQYPHSGFSIFTGTVGENRKSVIELHNDKTLFAFVKIAITEAATILVDNEAKMLRLLNNRRFHTLLIPKLLDRPADDTVVLNNIKPQLVRQHSTLSQLHIQALKELYATAYEYCRWDELGAFRKSKERIETLLAYPAPENGLDKEKIKKIASSLLILIEHLEENRETICTSTAHGDFTPWNMYISPSKLHLFDWELGQSRIPLLFDLFHFAFQSEIMIRNASYNKILSMIKKVLKMHETQEMIKTFRINPDTHYLFYLVYNISYYLDKYISQKTLHIQVFWQMDVWEDAILDAIEKKEVLFEK